MALKAAHGGSGYLGIGGDLTVSADLPPPSRVTSSTVNPATDSAERIVLMSGLNPCGSPPAPTT